jgi:hypothetical protein
MDLLACSSRDDVPHMKRGTILGPNESIRADIMWNQTDLTNTESA